MQDSVSLRSNCASIARILARHFHVNDSIASHSKSAAPRSGGLLATFLLLVPGLAAGASLSPANVSATINVGERIVIPKTVTLDASGPAVDRVDVFFLSDNTGSMGGIITGLTPGTYDFQTRVRGLSDAIELDRIVVTAVPIPVSVLLFASALIGIAVVTRRRAQN